MVFCPKTANNSKKSHLHKHIHSLWHSLSVAFILWPVSLYKYQIMFISEENKVVLVLTIFNEGAYVVKILRLHLNPFLATLLFGLTHLISINWPMVESDISLRYNQYTLVLLIKQPLELFWDWKMLQCLKKTLSSICQILTRASHLYNIVKTGEKEIKVFSCQTQR